MSFWLTKRIIYLLVILLSAATGVSKWKNLNQGFKLLSVLLTLTFLSETAAVICAYVYKNTVLVYDIFDPLEELMFTFIFASTFVKSISNKIIISGVIIAFVIISFSVFFSNIKIINTFPVIIKSAFLIILSLLLFKKILAEPYYENIMKEPLFWLGSATLLFFTINFLFWTSYHYLSETTNNIMMIFVDVLYYSNLVFYLMLWYSFVITKKSQPTGTNG